MYICEYKGAVVVVKAILRMPGYEEEVEVIITWTFTAHVV